jgi:hypothetical protein
MENCDMKHFFWKQNLDFDKTLFYKKRLNWSSGCWIFFGNLKWHKNNQQVSTKKQEHLIHNYIKEEASF